MITPNCLSLLEYQRAHSVVLGSVFVTLGSYMTNSIETPVLLVGRYPILPHVGNIQQCME